MGSRSAKPCSFSPLKPDYSGGACACVRACVRAPEGRRRNFTTSVCSCTGPSCPRAAPGTTAASPLLRGTAPRWGLSPSPLSPCHHRRGRVPAVVVRAGHAGAQQEVSNGAWRWTLRLLVGLGGACCSFLRGLEVDAMATHGAWRWTLWLLMVFGGVRHSCPWRLEVDAVATYGACRLMLWLLLGFGDGCHGCPWSS